MVFSGFKKIFFLFLISLLWSGCTKTIEIEGFDKAAWKQDKLGCDGVRDELSIVLFTNKGQLFNTNQRAISKLLGSPNQKQLYRRNQQFFVYYLSPGSQCDNGQDEEGATLHIRFGALNKVNEVFIVE